MQEIDQIIKEYSYLSDSPDEIIRLYKELDIIPSDNLLYWLTIKKDDDMYLKEVYAYCKNSKKKF